MAKILLDSRNGSGTASLNIEAGSCSQPNMAAKDKIDKNDIVKAEDTKRGEDAKMTVPFYKLFMMADKLDIILMSIATVASAANGLSFPIMAILFGNLTNAFGQHEGRDIDSVVHEVSKVKLISPK